MSRYIDADEAIYATTRAIAKCIPILQGHNAKVSLKVVEAISTLPSIDLADYVPKDFHDKTCEAMAKAHQEEITDLVSVVRCSECKKSHIDGKTTHYLWCTEWGRSTDTFGYCERADRKE